MKRLSIPSVVVLIVVACSLATPAAVGADELIDAVPARVRDGLPNVGAKLRGGRPVRVAYIGGSITAAEQGWRPQTTAWLRERFPRATITETNAALSGTGSTLGAFRFRGNVLVDRPDLVFIEFAVNDTGRPPRDVRRAVEGMVRQARAHDPQLDVCLVYAAQERTWDVLRQGKLPPSASAMEAVAERYGLPSVHLADEAVRLEREGRLVVRAAAGADQPGRMTFSRDGIHPLPETGHRLYAEALARWLPAMFEVKPSDPKPLPAPLEVDHLERATTVPLRPETMLSGGWQRLAAEDPLTQRFARLVPGFYVARSPDDVLTVRFRGTHVGVFDLVGPDVGHVAASIDGGPPALHSRFNAFRTGYQLKHALFAADLPDGEHTLRVSLSPEPHDGADLSKPAWRVAEVLVVGEIAEAGDDGDGRDDGER